MFVESRISRFIDRLRARVSLPLRVQLWTGRTYDLAPDPAVTLVIPERSALRYLLSPDLARLGEAYVEGRIRVEGGARDIFRVAESLVRGTSAAGRRGSRRVAWHGKSRDRRAIAYHYDVSNDFYALFLDSNMVYSCAYYRSDADTLESAQVNKLDHILNKLMVRPGERLLDIGCGWGALILRAALQYGAHATGITLSRNQFEFVQRKIREQGLEGRCEVRLQDYRDVPEHGAYDRIASVGMFEHVGLRNLPEYFARIGRLLRPGGLVLNHGITATDPDSRWVGMGAGQFIHRYVFPHGELPHLSLVLREISRAGLEVADVESLRRHYAKTCDAWAARLEVNRDRAVASAGERRYRIWQIYLAGCAFGFAHGWMNVYQVLGCKGRDGDLGVLPMTRDHVYAR